MIRFAAMLCTLAIGLLLSSAAFAKDPWVETDTDHNVRVHLYFFWSQTCPHCLEAHPLVEAIPNERARLKSELDRIGTLLP